MHLPNRSLKSIQPLPSIYTTFPIHYDHAQSSIDSAVNSGTCLIRQIEDGIEVVPFERCNTTSAPILSPDPQDEKEVCFLAHHEASIYEKPLPSLPRSLWLRMSLRQRILVLLGIQFILLMTIGLTLMAAKGSASQGGQSSEVRSASDGTSAINTTYSIRRGMFAVPIQLPLQQSSACLADMNELVAWQCASDTTFQLNIFPSPAHDNDTTMVSLGSPLRNGTITHGHQVPEVPPVPLTAIKNGAQGNNTAYHFRTTYDKVTFLREADLASAETPRAQLTTHHPTFQVGDSLWRCVFNETLIEGYIYVNQPTTPDVANNGTNANTSLNTSIAKSPYVVKLVEQRIPNGRNPYCEKMTVQRDGSLSSPSKTDFLNLVGPAARNRPRDSLVTSARVRIRQQTPAANYCTCQWLTQ